jgi:hypothetical protein
LKHNLWARCLKREVKNGEAIDQSAPSLGIDDIRTILKHHALVGSAAACEARFTLLSLWQVCGLRLVCPCVLVRVGSIRRADATRVTVTGNAGCRPCGGGGALDVQPDAVVRSVQASVR